MSHTPGEARVVEKTLELTKLLLAFGRINRVTQHEDGVRYETDSDHTVMLGVMACAFAKEFAPKLDTGKIAEFALVHDLSEVYAGDTMSFKIATAEEKEEKEKREHAAAVRIREEFEAVFPWLPDTLEAYERLDTPEACYVKFFDKILPKLTHILNDGSIVRDLGHTVESMHEFHAHQIKSIMGSYGAKFPEVEALYLAVAEQMEKVRVS